MIAEMEQSFKGANGAEKMKDFANETAKDKFKKDRERQIAIKKKRKLETKKLEDKHKEEEDLIFQNEDKMEDTNDEAEVVKLKKQIKNLKRKFN